MSERADTLRARVFAREAPARGQLARVTAALDQLARLLGIAWIEEARWRDYTAARLRRILDGPPTTIILRDGDERLALTIHLGAGGRWGLVADLEAPLELFSGELEATRLFKGLVDLAQAARAAAAWAHSSLDLELGAEPARALDDGRVSQICWLNVFGPELAGRLGADRCASVPAARVECLADGAIAFATAATPASFASIADRRRQAEALAHFDAAADRDALLAALLERSRALVPIARTWDPDLAELLELVVAREPIARRNRKAAELNRYRPPEVTEFRRLPPGGGLAPDADLRDALETDAETLVALLHAEVPEVARDSGGALPHIDAFFWRTGLVNRRSQTWVDGVLVPSLGAYLGTLLVEELGGRWIAGARPDQSSVALGDRAWLPFERARNFVTSHRSAIDYSMTKFFQAARRRVQNAELCERRERQERRLLGVPLAERRPARPAGN